VVHPSPEIPQELVDKIVARRGRLHIYEQLDPSCTALVVIDMDVGSCAREPELTESAIDRVNTVSGPLRASGGTVAFVTSEITDPVGLGRRLGDSAAAMYEAETRPGGIGTILAPTLVVEAEDLRARKTGASAFFPGRCDLHTQLQDQGVRSLLIAGLVTNVCCESSARDACELGYQVTMVSDANVGHSYGLHEASLSTFFRVFGDVRPAADVVQLIAEPNASSVSP
jgi:nicotinamidase-related amidase